MTLANPLLPLHARAGAALGDWFGCQLPARFSRLEQECAFASESVALYDTHYQASAWLTGADRVRYLNAVTTNNIKDLAPGAGVTGLLLNPQGHILAEIATYALPDRLLLRFHASAGERTLATLEKFIIMDDAALADATTALGSVALEGPAAPQVLRQVCGVDLAAMGDYAHREITFDGIACRVIRRSHFARPGAEFLAASETVADLWNRLATAARALRGGRIGWEAITSLRLDAGIAWFGYDFDDKVIPHEAGLEHSHISYTKGCYTGQEIVERVRARGQVNRRLTALRFSGTEPPPAGTKLLASEKEVGHVTSAAFSPRAQAAIGFAYLRREHASPGTRLAFTEGFGEVL